MSEKWTYFFIGLISATVLYVLIVLGVIFVDIKIKSKKEVYNPIREIGSFKCDNNTFETTFDKNIVISDGYLYNINLNMIFSNEQNCMKISDINIIKAIDNYYIDNDKKMYTVTEKGLTEYKGSVTLPEYLLDDTVIKAYSYGASNEYKYYVLKNDGKIYSVEFKREFKFLNGSGAYKYDVLAENVYKEIAGEVIKSFDINNKKIDFIVTNKSIYTNVIVNPECMNYADIDCEYELKENTLLEIPMQDIRYINLFEGQVKYITSDKAYSIDV